VLDEIEKAHADVFLLFNTLLQVLDDGGFTERTGTSGDFRTRGHHDLQQSIEPSVDGVTADGEIKHDARGPGEAELRGHSGPSSSTAARHRVVHPASMGPGSSNDSRATTGRIAAGWLVESKSARK